jgi:hypothetical protein
LIDFLWLRELIISSFGRTHLAPVMLVDAHETMDAVVPLTFGTGSILHGSSSRDELCHLCESWKDLCLKSNEMSEMLRLSPSQQSAFPDCFATENSIFRSSETDTILSSTETIDHGKI